MESFGAVATARLRQERTGSFAAEDSVFQSDDQAVGSVEDGG